MSQQSLKAARVQSKPVHEFRNRGAGARCFATDSRVWMVRLTLAKVEPGLRSSCATRHSIPRPTELGVLFRVLRNRPMRKRSSADDQTTRPNSLAVTRGPKDNAPCQSAALSQHQRGLIADAKVAEDARDGRVGGRCGRRARASFNPGVALRCAGNAATHLLLPPHTAA